MFECLRRYSLGMETFWVRFLVQTETSGPALLCPSPIASQCHCVIVPLCPSATMSQSLCVPVSLGAEPVVSRCHYVLVPLCPIATMS